MDKTDKPISIEKFAAYLDGNLEPKDMRDVFMQISGDDALQEITEQCHAVTQDMDSYSIADEGLPADEIEIPQTEFIDDNIYNDFFYHEKDMNDLPFGQLTADDILQKYPDTCAIKSQQIILESNDVNITEDELVSESIANGWYTPGQGGTSQADVGNLLEIHGMTVSRFVNASIDDIVAELAQGHHVIVGVDSGELWNSGTWETFEDFLNSKGADHALIVSGIQLNPLTAEREVILTDPGTGEVAHTYSVDQFMNAWNDSDNFMVIAEI